MWLLPFLLFIQPILLGNAEDIKSRHILKEDREQIASLFKYLFLDQGFAYVLFGDKPMSSASELRGESSDFEIELAWKKWEKYSHLFDMKDFVFFTNSDEKWFTVFLFNKKSCAKVIAENMSLFREKLNCQSNPEEILEKIVKSHDVYFKGLDMSDALLGILFGFGTKNAIGFDRYQRNGPKWAPEQSLNYMAENYELPLCIPQFVPFSDQETNKLVDSYKKQRKEILNFLSEENVLETCLKRLIEH